jgi:hypothetical protein
MRLILHAVCGAALLFLLSFPTCLEAEEHSIDTARSVIRVRVYKTGLFAAFAHDHEIEAPISRGAVEMSPHPSVELRVQAAQLHVLDPELSADKRAEIQERMESPEVLDSLRFPEILFRSTAAEMKLGERWTIRGELTLHGETRPVTLDVAQQGGRFVGSTSLNQSDFGIVPVSIAGGAVRVKNQVRIEFDVLLVK